MTFPLYFYLFIFKSKSVSDLLVSIFVIRKEYSSSHDLHTSLLCIHDFESENLSFVTHAVNHWW